jgi:hypothetical protein
MIVISTQYHYLQRKNLGFDKEQLVYIQMKGSLTERLEALRSELMKNSKVKDVSYTSSILTRGAMYKSNLHWEGKPEDVIGKMGFVSVGYNFFKTMNIEMAEGRSFSPKYPDSHFDEIIVNEEAARLMNLDETVGTRAHFPNSRDMGTIVGVCKNYHFMPLKENVAPLVLGVNRHRFKYILVRIQPESIRETLQFLENTCRTFEPSMLFECRFMDEALENLYRAEKQTSTLFKGFSIFGVFISCLSLIGLVSFVIEKRKKEIGIRKVFGAGAQSIVGLIMKEFIFLVILANMIAWPAAWFSMRRWLASFANRIDIHVSFFLFSMAGILFIVLVTVGVQSMEAASRNPVDSLRND